MTSLRIALLVAALALARAAPAPAPAPGPAPAPSGDDRPEIIEIIAPAASAQETLDSLNLGEPGSELSERNKRTIGILRQLFPTLTQIVEQKIQNFTSMIFQTFGPFILGALGGGGSGGAGGGTVTFDDDDDDVESIDDGLKNAKSVEFPDFVPDEKPGTDTIPSPSSSAPILSSEDPPTTARESQLETKTTIKAIPNIETTKEKQEDIMTTTEMNTSVDITTTTVSSLPSSSGASDDKETEDSAKTEENAKTIRKRSVAQGSSADENQLLSGAESQQQEVRVQFAEGAGKDLQTAASEDQETAAQTNSGQLEEISLEDGDTSEENRNKRFLNFGFGGGAGAGGSGGSGGGSGNFLFDIIRLVAGSSATEPADDGGDAVATDDGATAAKGDGLTEGVPGPVTRLFIIANRGIANLIQDLILRLAQTSERIVNFKARLITSII